MRRREVLVLLGSVSMLAGCSGQENGTPSLSETETPTATPTKTSSDTVTPTENEERGTDVEYYVMNQTEDRQEAVVTTLSEGEAVYEVPLELESGESVTVDPGVEAPGEYGIEVEYHDDIYGFTWKIWDNPDVGGDVSIQLSSDAVEFAQEV